MKSETIRNRAIVLAIKAFVLFFSLSFVVEYCFLANIVPLSVLPNLIMLSLFGAGIMTFLFMDYKIVVCDWGNQQGEELGEAKKREAIGSTEQSNRLGSVEVQEGILLAPHINQPSVVISHTIDESKDKKKLPNGDVRLDRYPGRR